MGLKEDTKEVLKKKNRAITLADGSNALPGDFNSSLYLQARPDVQKAIDDGTLNSAEEHWQMQGFQEDNSGYNKLKADTIAALNKPKESAYQSLVNMGTALGKPVATSAPIDYQARAKAIFDPTYNTRVADVNNEANLAIQGYDNQRGAVQTNYADQMKSANTNIAMGKNNATRRAISSGLLESQNTNANLNSMDNQGNELRNRIDTARTDSLNNIENMKNVIRQNLQSKLGSMKNDYETGLAAKADDLRKYDDSLALQKAGYTGMLDGQQTIQGKQADVNLQGAGLDNQLKSIGIDTAKLNLAALPVQIKNQATLISQQIQKGDIDIQTGQQQLKELLDPDSYTNQMKAIGLDTARINLAALPEQLKNSAALVAQQLRKGDVDIQTAQRNLEMIGKIPTLIGGMGTSSGTKASSNPIRTGIMTDFQNAVAADITGQGNAYQWLEQYKNPIINTLGADEYDKMKNVLNQVYDGVRKKAVLNDTGGSKTSNYITAE